MRMPRGLDSVDVLDLNGDPKRLAELWQERAVVLCFIRHFG
jgi:hypothetical protein